MKASEQPIIKIQNFHAPLEGNLNNDTNFHSQFYINVKLKTYTISLIILHKIKAC